MTDDMMNLRALVEKGSDADLLREMIAFVAERLMELEVESLTGAAHGERARTRLNQRNGYRTASGTPASAPCRWHPEASQEHVFPVVSRASPLRRQGHDRGDPGSLRARRLDALGRRSGQGDGHDRHLQEPGVAAVRGDRRPRQGVPQPADRRLLALRVDRRHLREGASKAAGSSRSRR